MDQISPPTELAHRELSRAFDAMNARLFDGELPDCLITLQRGRGFAGYFSAHRFIRADATTTHEIAINPQIFALATVQEVLSELVHNMVHLWAHIHGEAGRRGYHTKGWAAKMESLGLMPSSTGLPGGKTTGEKIEHYIVEGGAFATAAESMVSEGFSITWLDRVASPWREGQGAPAGRHLLGEALLGISGLLVDSQRESDDESDDGSGPALDEYAPNARASQDASAENALETTEAVHDASSLVDDDGERDPWEAPAPTTSITSAVPLETSLVHEGDVPGHSAPVVLDTGTRSRRDDNARVVPLILRSGEDLEGHQVKKRRDKVKFTCPTCAQKAWAKGGAKLDCGECKIRMAPSEEA